MACGFCFPAALCQTKLKLEAIGHHTWLYFYLHLLKFVKFKGNGQTFKKNIARKKYLPSFLLGSQLLKESIFSHREHILSFKSSLSFSKDSCTREPNSCLQKLSPFNKWWQNLQKYPFSIKLYFCSKWPKPLLLKKSKLYVNHFKNTFHTHYENTPIQIYWKFYNQKLANFQIKNSNIFHISAQNIDCGYMLELPQRGGSNKYPQSMFWAEIRKIIYTPVNPRFTI